MSINSELLRIGEKVQNFIYLLNVYSIRFTIDFF